MLVQVHAVDARADARHDLVADGLGPAGPLLGGGLAAVAGAEDHGGVADLDGQVADVEHELVHGDATGDREAAAVQEHGSARGGDARDPVGVAERHEHERRRPGGAVIQPVGDAVPGLDALDGDDVGLERHGGDQTEIAAGAVVERRDAVDRDAESHHVEAGGRQADPRGARGQVLLHGSRARLLGHAHRIVEAGERGVVVLGRGVGQVRPQRVQGQLARGVGGDGRAHEVRPQLGGGAVAAEPGVGLEVHAGPDPRGAPGGGDALQLPQRRDAEVDPLLHRDAEVGVDPVQPGQEAGGDARPAELDRRRDVEHGEALGAGLEGGARDLERAVPVGVGLHGDHRARRGGERRERADVVADRVEVDDGAAAGRDGSGGGGRVLGHAPNLRVTRPATRATIS